MAYIQPKKMISLLTNKQVTTKVPSPAVGNYDEAINTQLGELSGNAT